MSEYIDVNVARARLMTLKEEAEIEGSDFLYARDVIEAFDDIESADVEAVRHAKWEKTNWQRREEWEYCCSACKRCKIWKKKTQKLPAYCEKCGAKMDGKVSI